MLLHPNPSPNPNPNPNPNPSPNPNPNPNPNPRRLMESATGGNQRTEVAQQEEGSLDAINAAIFGGGCATSRN